MMDTAKVIQVIETRLTRRGNGRDDPIRVITQYWSLQGELLAEVDPQQSVPPEQGYPKLLTCTYCGAQAEQTGYRVPAPSCPNMTWERHPVPTRWRVETDAERLLRTIPPGIKT